MLLDQRARELAATEDNVRRYQAAVAQAQGQLNHEIYAALKNEVWEARAALAALRAGADRIQRATLSPDEIQQIRRQAQEDAISVIARAQGWQWDDAGQRWRTAEGAWYSRLGEPL
jgi:predicted transcriptional regulator